MNLVSNKLIQLLRQPEQVLTFTFRVSWWDSNSCRDFAQKNNNMVIMLVHRWIHGQICNPLLEKQKQK